MRTYRLCDGFPYRNNSAGIRALHRLIHELNLRGYPAYADGGNPDWRELPTWAAPDDAIVIYPEVVSGNPLGAERVVRWVLNTPGLLGGDHEYPTTERVFSWSKDYLDAPLLTVDLIEHELFNDGDLFERGLDCVYFGKGAVRGVALGAERTHGMVAITAEWPETRPDLAALLRRSRTLFTYDDRTMLIDEAIACGCDVVLLPEETPVTCVTNEIGHETSVESFIASTQDWELP